MAESTFKINENHSRFELVTDGQISIIEFVLAKGDAMVLTHTEVPKLLEGKGIGSEIVQKALAYIKNHNMTVVPLCPFVASYVKRHPEWQSIVADQ